MVLMTSKKNSNEKSVLAIGRDNIKYSSLDDVDEYDRSLEYRQIARWILIVGLILFIASIFGYVLFVVD